MKYRAQGIIFRKILERLKAGLQGLRVNQAKGSEPECWVAGLFFRNANAYKDRKVNVKLR